MMVFIGSMVLGSPLSMVHGHDFEDNPKPSLFPGSLCSVKSLQDNTSQANKMGFDGQKILQHILQNLSVWLETIIISADE